MAYGDKGRIVRDLQAILSGGYCTRWHANADLAHIRETLAEHHARVAQIILALHPAPSLALIDAALHHSARNPPWDDADPVVDAEEAWAMQQTARDALKEMEDGK